MEKDRAAGNDEEIGPILFFHREAVYLTTNRLLKSLFFTTIENFSTYTHNTVKCPLNTFISISQAFVFSFPLS